MPPNVMDDSSAEHVLLVRIQGSHEALRDAEQKLVERVYGHDAVTDVRCSAIASTYDEALAALKDIFADELDGDIVIQRRDEGALNQS